MIFHNASLTDNQGSVTGLIGAIRDITERKRAEEALRESEEKYRTLVEKANEAIMIAQDDVFVFANSRMSDLLGVPAGKLEGKPFVDFIWPEDRDLVVTNHRKRIAGELISDAYDFRIIGAGGMLTWVYLSAAVIPWKGKTATLNLVTDITERKKAEEALRMSEQKLNSILNNITDVVWSLSWPDMKVHYISPSAEQVYGRSVQEFIDKPSLWAEVVYPDDRHISDKVLEELQKSGSAMRVCRIVRPDGSIAWIQDRSKFIYDEHGSPVRTEGITSDITARKRAEEALSRVNKKLTLLSGITRHDINNQLTVQMGYLNILEKKEPDTTRNEYFQKVSTAAKRISAMIQFTKEYEEIGVHAPAWQDGRTLVDTAAKQVPLGRVTVKNDLTAGTEVFADPLIAKVFYTLMDNAVRHGGKITAIRFSIEERDGDQVLICEDDGNGVVADEKEKIFERGFGKNTGLGLFISHEILGITGITITETGEPGKGARFEMTVPKGMWRISETDEMN
ncbi:MAG: PAS domain S-box protein, partial [Methanoregula sp.]|nr:PAS domain S-box protein [Methanoregula sp.]